MKLINLGYNFSLFWLQRNLQAYFDSLGPSQDFTDLSSSSSNLKSVLVQILVTVETIE